MMKEGEYNNMPVAGLAGLPPNPAPPGHIDAWIDWRDWLLTRSAVIGEQKALR